MRKFQARDKSIFDEVTAGAKVKDIAVKHCISYARVRQILFLAHREHTVGPTRQTLDLLQEKEMYRGVSIDAFDVLQRNGIRSKRQLVEAIKNGKIDRIKIGRCIDTAYKIIVEIRGFSGIEWPITNFEKSMHERMAING